MAGNSKQRALNHRYEISGNLLPRQIRFWFRMKTSIMGNFDSGPGLKNLIILWWIHYIGKPLFWLKTRLQGQHHLNRLVGLFRFRVRNKSS